jgi:hypothetical protein
MKATKAQVALFNFLKEKEHSKKYFSIEELVEATQWKRSTFNTYFNKGQLAEFINKTETGKFEASNCQSISEVEFAKKLSQAKHLQTLGHNCKSKLAKALLKKARDNMLLALELYNRPSLENRMDAFVMCFCTSWELFIKAIIIEDDGEDAIFKGKGKLGLKETYSLRECLNKTLFISEPIKKNIRQITNFRDQAVHLLMPEVQGIISRIFQSGVLNFTSKFEEFTEVSFLNQSHAGMISLVGDSKMVSITALQSLYGDISEDILNLAQTLEAEIETTDDKSFAIPLNFKLVFGREDSDGNIITIAKAEDGIKGLEKALVLEKPVDRSRSHPYLQKQAIELINQRLYEKYVVDKINLHLVATTNSAPERKIINKNCFDAVLAKNGWKLENNIYHYKNLDPVLHYYSETFITEFIEKIMASPTYLFNAKRDFNRSNFKGRKNK